MKCESIEQKILLAQSGELSGIGRWRLARHVRACTRCRQYEADLERLTVLARSADAEVSGAVLENIRAVARKERSRSVEIRLRPSREPAAVMWRPALLYGALSILFLVGFWLVIRPALRPAAPQVAEAQPAKAVASPAEADWDDSVDSRISELGDLLAMTSGDNGYSESYEVGADTEDINSMAQELLALEGQQI